MDLLLKPKISLLKSFKHADVHFVEGCDIVIVEATSPYIPIENFKEIFNYVGNFVKEGKVAKLIFDKRTLTVFHQPSMEWYFVHWKEEMFNYGLNTHRKLLPNNIVFTQSVKLGRDKINRDHPNGKFHLMNIKYCQTIEEAIKV